MTRVEAASSTLFSRGRSAAGRMTLTTGIGAVAGLGAGDGDGASLSSAGWDVPWICSTSTGEEAALRKSAVVALCRAVSAAVPSGRIRAGLVSLLVVLARRRRR